jgi:hypothetical protein
MIWPGSHLPFGVCGGPLPCPPTAAFAFVGEVELISNVVAVVATIITEAIAAMTSIFVASNFNYESHIKEVSIY